MNGRSILSDTSYLVLGVLATIVLGSVAESGGITPLIRSEELAAVGGSGPSQVCPTAPNATCPACFPPIGCALAAAATGPFCTNTGGSAGCSSPGGGNFICVWAYSLWCSQSAPAYCGTSQTPFCALTIVAGLPTCPSGAGTCAAGGSSTCSTC